MKLDSTKSMYAQNYMSVHLKKHECQEGLVLFNLAIYVCILPLFYTLNQTF